MRGGERERVRGFDVDVFEDRIWSENEKMMPAPDDTASDLCVSVVIMLTTVHRNLSRETERSKDFIAIRWHYRIRSKGVGFCSAPGIPAYVYHVLLHHSAQWGILGSDWSEIF